MTRWQRQRPAATWGPERFEPDDEIIVWTSPICEEEAELLARSSGRPRLLEQHDQTRLRSALEQAVVAFMRSALLPVDEASVARWSDLDRDEDGTMLLALPSLVSGLVSGAAVRALARLAFLSPAPWHDCAPCRSPPDRNDGV